jgi:glycosyltransferase involved in cell wall biosynthesis
MKVWSVAHMRVALIHDWLNGMRGGEKILEVLCELFPDAVIHTLLCDRSRLSPAISKMEIKTSLLQRLPLARSKYRYYLPVFPRLIERFNFEGFDLVISTSHCVAKGAIPSLGALSICYCLTPMRYVWYFGDEYFSHWGWKRRLLAPAFEYLKRWDVASSQRVDLWIAISEHVAARVQKIYNKRAEVIYPPVNAAFFTPGGKLGDYYLIVSALVPYKRIDIAIRAFNEAGLRLKIVGEGPQRKRLQAMAGPGVEFLGWKTDAEVRDLYRGCRAFIFPGEEDFGITPLEAQACGRPVIAYGKGGALETVREGETGVFFFEQTPEALAEAVRKFALLKFDAHLSRANAMRFDRAEFKKRLHEYITTSIKRFRPDWLEY